MPAKRAKTPTGAVYMMSSTTLMMTSLRLSKKAISGVAFSRGIMRRAMPRRRATKTTWSMLPLSEADPKKLSGTMSSSGWSGPRSWAASAASVWEMASSA